MTRGTEQLLVDKTNRAVSQLKFFMYEQSTIGALNDDLVKLSKLIDRLHEMNDEITLYDDIENM